MREPKLGVAVGKKGVGKTYTTNIMLQQYIKGNPAAGVKPRRALILDVNDEYEEIRALKLSDVMKFSVHQNIEARRIRPFHDDGRRMTSNEIADTLFFILNTYRGGLLLIEDINRYISDYLPNDLVGAICTNRHTDTDIIMHFQSIGRITTKIWQNINWLRFHKNTDSVDRHQQKFQDKYELFKIVELMVNKQYYAGNNRFYVFVDVDEEKILGNYTRQMFEDAMQEYIDFAYRKIISPLLAEKTMEGKKKHTPQSAMEFVKNRIRANYLKKK
jgi:hypothetical protein